MLLNHNKNEIFPYKKKNHVSIERKNFFSSICNSLTLSVRMLNENALHISLKFITHIQINRIIKHSRGILYSYKYLFGKIKLKTVKTTSRNIFAKCLIILCKFVEKSVGKHNFLHWRRIIYLCYTRRVSKKNL